MNKKPMISVIMPIYNGEKYLDEAIQSILNQTYRNFEFIIINDGSTDKSLEIIEKYRKQDGRVILRNRENRGIVASLNEGIKIARGEYIARMDADDISSHNRFSEQLTFMQQNNLDLCGSWIESFDEKTISLLKYPESHNDNVFRMFFKTSFAHPSVMIKKEVFIKLQYEEEIAEDYRLWCDIAVQGYKIGNIQKSLLKYRLHEKQITQTNMEELVLSANQIGMNFVDKIDENMVRVVEKAIESQRVNSYVKFKQLLEEIIIFSDKYDIKHDNLKFILKTLYSNSNPKNLLIFYAYYQATKGLNKDINEEVELFLKSIIIVKKESWFYQFLKEIKSFMK